MRRFSGGGRLSLASRVKNEAENLQPGNSRGRPSNGSGQSATSGGSRSSFGRPSYGGNRPSLTGIKRPVLGKTGISRPSTGLPTKKRRSSGYGRGGYEQMKECRPIANRAYKEKCISKLLEFLATHLFPHPMNIKILHNPQTKDFTRIFEFLFNFLEPKFKMKGKLEDEVPRLFKMMNYPFTISKSSMFSIGSPHTWPSLLAALTWLREKIEIFVNVNVEYILFPQDDEFNAEPESKLLFNYLEETYKMFLNGAESYEEWEEKLAMQICQGNLNLEELVSDNRTRSKELEMLQEKPNGLQALKERAAMMEIDQKTFDNYYNELEAYSSQLAVKKKKGLENINAIEEELAPLNAENKRKQHVFDTQQISQTDIQRLNLDRQQLDQKRAAVERDNEVDQQQIWAEEMAMSKDYEKIERSCGEFNRIAQFLQLIPITAQNAHGIDYEMQPSRFHSESSGPQYINTIKPALNQMKHQCKIAMNKTQEKKFNEKDQLEQISELLAEKREALTMMETKLKRLEESLESKKNMMQQENKKQQEELDELQDELARNVRHNSMSVQQASGNLQEQRAKNKSKAAMRRSEMRSLTSNYYQHIMTVVDHKTAITKFLENLHQKVLDMKEDAANELMKLSIPIS